MAQTHTTYPTLATCTDWCVRVIHYPPLSKGTFHNNAQGLQAYACTCMQVLRTYSTTCCSIPLAVLAGNNTNTKATTSVALPHHYIPSANHVLTNMCRQACVDQRACRATITLQPSQGLLMIEQHMHCRGQRWSALYSSVVGSTRMYAADL